MHPEAALPLQCTQQQHLNCLICLEPHTALPTCFHRCELIATHIGTHTNMHTCTHARNSLVLSYQTDTARVLSLSLSNTQHDIAQGRDLFGFDLRQVHGQQHVWKLSRGRRRASYRVQHDEVPIFNPAGQNRLKVMGCCCFAHVSNS